MSKDMNWNANIHKLEVFLTARDILHFLFVNNDRDMIEVIWEYLQENKNARDAIRKFLEDNQT